jgi:hypothetical protein
MSDAQKLHPGGHGLALVVGIMRGTSDKSPYNLSLAIIGNPFAEKEANQHHVECKHKPSVQERELFAYCVNNAHQEVKMQADVSLHRFGQFLQYPIGSNVPLRAAMIRRPSETLKASCFPDPKQKFPNLVIGDIVRLNGLTFDVKIQVGADMVSTNKEYFDDTVMVRVKKVLKKGGECFLNVDVKQVSFYSKSNFNTIAFLLKESRLVPMQEMRNSRPMNIPENTLIIESVELTKTKTTKNLTNNVVVPFFVPTEIIESRAFNDVIAFFRVDNAAFITGKDAGSHLPQLVAMETPRGDPYIIYEDQDKVKHMRLGGNERQLVHDFPTDMKSDEGKPLNAQILSYYFESFIRRFGVFSITIWQNVAEALARSFRFIGMLRLNIENPLVSDRSAFVLSGITDAIAIDYRTTFQNAGLRVSMQFAVNHLLQLQKDTNRPHDVLLPSMAVDDPNSKLLAKPETANLVNVFCLNTFDGKPPAEADWLVYAIPPREGLAKTLECDPTKTFDEDRTILTEQNFASKDSDSKEQLKDNETETLTWYPVKSWRSSVTFFAVRNRVDDVVMNFNAKKATVPTMSAAQALGFKDEPAVAVPKVAEKKHTNDDLSIPGEEPLVKKMKTKIKTPAEQKQ